MTHVFHHSIRDNGVLAFLPPAALKILTAYDMFADDFGNTWASSSSKSKRALNRATGYAHGAVIAGRKVLFQHGIIAHVDRETIKRLYGSRTRKPPYNATVWHITCTIRRCLDEQCLCQSLLPEGESALFYLPERNPEDGDTDNETNDLSENRTSSKIEHEVSNSKPVTKDNPIDSPAIPKTTTRKANSYFDNLALVCQLDPLTSGSFIAKYANIIKYAQYEPEAILRFGEIWYTREYPGGLKDKKPPTPATVAKYIIWTREAPSAPATTVTATQQPDESYLDRS